MIPFSSSFRLFCYEVLLFWFLVKNIFKSILTSILSVLFYNIVLSEKSRIKFDEYHQLRFHHKEFFYDITIKQCYIF